MSKGKVEKRKEKTNNFTLTPVMRNKQFHFTRPRPKEQFMIGSSGVESTRRKRTNIIAVTDG